MSLGGTLLLFSAALSMALSILTFWRDPRDKVRQVFLLLVSSIVFWTIAVFFSNIVNGQTLLWTKLTFLAASSIVTFLLYFVQFFPNKSKSLPIWVHISIIIPSVLTSLLLIFSNKIIADFTILENSTGVIWGDLYLLWVGIFGAYFLACIIITVSNLIHAKAEEKSQYNYFLGGLLATFGFGMGANLILPIITGNDALAQYGPYATTFFVFFTSYAIVRNEKAESKIITTKTFATALNVALFFNAVLSTTLTGRVIGWSVLILSIFINYRLVKAMTAEVLQREKLETMTDDLTKANTYLMGLDKAKDNFLAMASHELNTPVAKIEGYLSMVLDDKIKGDISLSKRGYISTAYNESTRLAGIIKELLVVSEIETDKVNLNKSIEQISDVVKEAIDKLSPQIAEAGHKITILPTQGSIPSSWFDRKKIYDVVWNILKNSIIYTPNGGSIEVAIGEEKNHIIVAVKDSGKGIDPASRDKIFTKFPQVDVLTEEVKGAGLGLYISKKYVELHGGKIWFESEGIGKGATFFFAIPLKTQTANLHRVNSDITTG